MQYAFYSYTVAQSFQVTRTPEFKKTNVIQRTVVSQTD